MYEISPAVTIDAPPAAVWEYLLDVEEWWVPSNPDHESIEIRSDDAVLTEGTRLRVKERIAGIPGVATGTVTELVPERRITWEAPGASYRYFGLTVAVDEGVTWECSPTQEGTELTAHVWATFPDSFFGRIVEWSFEHVLDGVEKDYEHATRELEYVKQELESGK